MATNVSICNVALLRVGVTETISSLTEASEASRACNVFFEPARDALLARFAWPFATRRAFLVQIDEVDEDTDLRKESWAFSYALPTDCLIDGAREIWSGTRNPRADQAIPFTTEHDATGDRAILYCGLDSEVDEVELLYTARLDNPALFPPLFCDALSWLLAAELATALKASDATEAKCRQRYEDALSHATAAAYRAGHDTTPETASLAARG